MFVFIVLGLLVLVIFWYEYQKKSSYRWKKLSEYPGDAPLPFFGNGLQLGFDADEASQRLMEMWERHGKQNFRLTVGSEDWVMLSDPDDVGTLLNHPTELSKPLERNVAMKPFFGNSISSSEGERWKSTRKLMTPTFHFKTLEKRVVDVNYHSDRLIATLDKFVDKDAIDVYRYLRPYMFDILCNTLMGVDSNLLANPDHPYLVESGKAIRIVTQNYFSYWRNIRLIFELSPQYHQMMKSIKIIRNTSTNIIKERKLIIKEMREDIKKNNKNSDIDIDKIMNSKVADNGCLLDKLLLSELPNGDPMPDEMINEEITLVCYTGHYTTTMSISHTLYCLAKYPEIQKRVIEEQRSIFKNDLNRKPTNQDLNDMKYLEAVLKESIRVIPTVTKIGRQVHEDLHFKGTIIKLKYFNVTTKEMYAFIDKHFCDKFSKEDDLKSLNTDGRVAPAGSSVIVFYEAMYQNPKVFPEPEKYDPERFFDNMHNFAFVPFSAGPRNCIGFRYAWVAMKATLSNMLRRYEVFPCDPADEPQFAYRIITESKNGINLKFKKRVL